MLKQAKDLAGMNPMPGCSGFVIMKFWHPDSGKGSEDVGTARTEEQAQEICKGPESSFKEGPTSDWWFLGYADGGSRSRHVRLW